MFLGGFVAATTANVLAGTLFEFLKRPSRINVGIVGDVAISAGNNWSFNIGDQIVVQTAQVFPVIVNANVGFLAGIEYPTHFWVQMEPGLAGDRLVLSITRATGNIFWAVQITEVV